MKNISSSNMTSNLPPSFGFFLFRFKRVCEIAPFVFSSLWFQRPFKKKIMSQIGACPQGWGVKIKKCLNKPPPTSCFSLCLQSGPEKIHASPHARHSIRDPTSRLKCFQFFLLKAKTLGIADVSNKNCGSETRIFVRKTPQKTMYDMPFVRYFEHLERFLCP